MEPGNTTDWYSYRDFLKQRYGLLEIKIYFGQLHKSDSCTEARRWQHRYQVEPSKIHIVKCFTNSVP